MKNLIIAIDQSTSATKAMLFNERCEMLKRVNVTHTKGTMDFVGEIRTVMVLVFTR